MMLGTSSATANDAAIATTDNMSPLNATPSATTAGILGVEIYVPKKCVDQAELERFDGVSAGKYTIGLGQSKMAFCDDREDINSICLTAVKSLLEKYNVSYDQIGRLEVGTETIIDKSKSVKSVLMQLFAESGNTNIEGVDTTNACYGGTNALFNSINWLESSSWDGRLAIVVAADIAVYKNGGARPTGGAGAVAILLGHNAPLVFDARMRVSHIEHVWDFYKPDLHSEYPEVDGPLSNTCYLRALDTCYNRYLDKLKKMNPDANRSVFDYMLFHCPYNKLVQKSYARLAFNDLRRNPEAKDLAAYANFANLAIDETYANKDLEKAFMDLVKTDYEKRVAPSLIGPKNIGNMYCGSLYAGLASLLSFVDSAELQNKRIGFFSYGSGLASSMFSVTVRGSTEAMAKNISLNERLAARRVADPSEFDRVMNLREKVHNARDYLPESPVDADNLFPGTYYLEKVDSKFRRSYARF